MTASANEGLIRQRLERIRGEDPTSAMDVGYQDAGISRAVQGDENGPYVRLPPFPSGPAPWFEHTFVDADYIILPTLEVGDIRTVTTFFAMTGGPDNASILSIVPASVLPGAPSPVVNLKDLYLFPVINPVIAAVTLGSPFTLPADSRTVMPAEFRTLAIDTGDILRFAMQWDVSAYERFTLALSDIGAGVEGSGGSLLVHYAFSN